MNPPGWFGLPEAWLRIHAMPQNGRRTLEPVKVIRAFPRHRVDNEAGRFIWQRQQIGRGQGGCRKFVRGPGHPGLQVFELVVLVLGAVNGVEWAGGPRDRKSREQA